MYKAVFSLLSLIPVFFYSLIDGEDVSITQKVPATMEIENAYQVDLIFNKGGDVQGFGKFQTSFPEGLEIDIIESAGATFTYTDGVMKLIWVNLPSENQFVVSYEIYPNENSPSKVDVGGKFSYLLENERKSFAILPETVLIGEQEEMAAEEEEEEEEFALSIFRKIQKTGEDQYNVSFVMQKSGIKGFSKIEEYVPRGAVVKAQETMNASFSYVKNKIKFVWLVTPQDNNMEVGCSVDLSAASDKDIFNTFGEFSYLDQKNKTQKLLVETRQANMKAPPKEEPVAETTEEETPTELNIGGVNIKLTEASEEEMAEMNNENETSSEEASQEETSQEEVSQAQEESTEELAENTEDAINDVSSSEANTEEPVKDAVENDDPQEDEMTTEQTNEMAESASQNEEANENQAPVQEATEQATNTSASSNNSSSGITAPQIGIFYKVQIAAGKNVVDAKYFETRHSWQNTFSIENHQGWVKYTTENTFPVYREARDKRNDINSNFNFDGPFVTAYNSGERITVQEALMITNQKWFK